MRLFAKRIAVAAFAASIALSLGAACTLQNGQPCYPGDYESCTCSDGAQGLAMCSQDGQKYGACNCSGLDAGGGGDAGGACDASAPMVNPGGAGFLQPCTKASDCESNVCHTFTGMSKTLCTIPCTVSCQCPAPSKGCSPMSMVCALP